MQGNGGGRDPFFGFGDPFAGFGGFNGFSGHRSLMPNFFGGRGPFDDPFFTRPFGGMFESGHFGHPGNPFTDAHASGFLEHQVPQPGYPGNPFTDAHASGFLEHQVPQPNRLRGPIIEELNSDDEKEGQQEKKDNPRKHSRSSKEPYVEVPDDEAEGRKSKQIQYRNDFSRPSNTYSQPQTHSFSFQSSSVTYGGENGAYYTSSRTRRTGSDGLTIEESKAADTASRQASHQVFRGIHDKGHTVARKLNSDGRVDKRQTLHNLNEEGARTVQQLHCLWDGCGEVFESYSELRRHVGGHVRNASRCRWLECSRDPESAALIKKHLDSHIKPHPCPEPNCTYSAAKARDLTRHVASHGIKPGTMVYSCPVTTCHYHQRGSKQPFTRPDNARRHIKLTHKGSAEEPVEGTWRPGE